MTPIQRNSIKLFFLAVYLFGMSYQVANAKALTYYVSGPAQFTTDWEGYYIEEGVYERQEYPFVGIYMELGVWRFDNPDHGDTWRLSLDDVETGQRLGSGTLIYDGASDCFVLFGQTSFCGIHVPDDSNLYWTYPFYMAFVSECLQTRDYKLVIEFLGDAIGGSPWEFRPTDFVPDPTIWLLPDTITPYIPETKARSGDSASRISEKPAGEARVLVQLKDNLGCGQRLEDVKLEIKNTIVEQSGSHKHFTSPDELGTGKYTESSPAWTKIEDNDTKITANTDLIGVVMGTYKASEYGVDEKVEVTAYYYPDQRNPDPNKLVKIVEAAEDNLSIKVPGLIPLDTSGQTYTLSGGFGDDCGDNQHNDGPDNAQRRSHYVTSKMYNLVRYVDFTFHQKFGYHLSFNDASLVNGGKFDASVRDSTCHYSHKQGVDVDVNVKGWGTCPDDYNLNCAADPENTYSTLRRRDFLDAVVNRAGGYRWDEGPLHFRFNHATNQ